jgi:formiminotetrahydrofolate cyclodeaminase
VTYCEQRITDFLDALASAEPVPGGGSGAALGGALAAALVSMVCNLTLGKKGYEAAQEAMADVLARSEALRAELAQLLEADTQVYSRVMAAYRLPRKAVEEKAAREEAIQAALIEASEAPLTIAARCAEVVELALPVAELGNRWAVSDAGVGALLAEACMQAALLNVAINLASISDAAYVQAARERMATLTAGKAEAKARVMALVNDRIGA